MTPVGLTIYRVYQDNTIAMAASTSDVVKAKREIPSEDRLAIEAKEWQRHGFNAAEVAAFLMVGYNVGAYMKDRKLTADGSETTFAVNFLAPFLLNNLLLDLLKKSAPFRTVNATSIAHMSADIDWSDLQGERGFGGYKAYSQSKLAIILFTYTLAWMLEGTGVTANCIHPGIINTKLLRAGFGMGGESVEEGIRTPVYLASSPDVQNVSNRYFDDCRPMRSSPIS
jgi:NAD(P)-dependent dehydrogenase (short-subunit alcohol dehydrogenase family)